MSEPWCDWGDMPKRDCQHCRDGKKVLGTTTVPGSGAAQSKLLSAPSGAFRAKYDGFCANADCKKRYAVGDLIVCLDGEGKKQYEHASHYGH